jgi:predicted extracellular nuclease
MPAQVQSLAPPVLIVLLLLAHVSEPSRSGALGLADPMLRIHAIQGAGHRSPHAGEAVADVPGIVTAIRSDGFYLQDPQPDAGQTLFVIANHLVAKAGDDPLFGRHQPPVEATRASGCSKLKCYTTSSRRCWAWTDRPTSWCWAT